MPSVNLDEFGELLTPGEVASIFKVDAKTVTRWAVTGRISSYRTVGGHRRYEKSEVKALLEGSHNERQSSAS
jgi:excisionase family DNA binding protein